MKCNNQLNMNGKIARIHPRYAIHIESDTGWAGHVRHRRDWRDTVLGVTWWAMRFAAGALCAYGAWLLAKWLLKAMVH